VLIINHDTVWSRGSRAGVTLNVLKHDHRRHLAGYPFRDRVAPVGRRAPAFRPALAL
jgi:hypothetical protein